MYATRVGSAWEVIAPAKLNLCLEVLGSRADGFHDLESLLVPVRLYDQLRWCPPAANSSASLRIRSLLRNQSVLPDEDPENLVLRAARRLADSAGIQPRGFFQLCKRIPMEAGLGGGSSDAAAALILSNVAWGINYPPQKLMKLAADVGSDVPFFISGGAAVCRGRGEIVEHTPGLPRLHFVVVKPSANLSTPAVFRKWKEQKDNTPYEEIRSGTVGKLIQQLRLGDLTGASRWMNNSLQGAATALSPTINRVASFMSRQGFAAHAMSGSGTAYWGLARSARQARNLAGRIANTFVGHVYCLSSCYAA